MCVRMTVGTHTHTRTHAHTRVCFGFEEQRVWNSAKVLMKVGVLSGHEGSSDGNRCGLL